MKTYWRKLERKKTEEAKTGRIFVQKILYISASLVCLPSLCNVSPIQRGLLPATEMLLECGSLPKVLPKCSCGADLNTPSVSCSSFNLFLDQWMRFHWAMWQTPSHPLLCIARAHRHLGAGTQGTFSLTPVQYIAFPHLLELVQDANSGGETEYLSTYDYKVEKEHNAVLGMRLVKLE